MAMYSGFNRRKSVIQVYNDMSEKMYCIECITPQKLVITNPQCVDNRVCAYYTQI